MMYYRRLIVVVGMLALAIGSLPTLAQDSDRGASVAPSAHPDSHDTEGMPFFIEPGPVRESTLYSDGSVIELQTETLSRLMCGSDPTGVTVEDLRRMAEENRAAFATGKDVVVVSGGTSGGGTPRDPGGPRVGLNIIFYVSSPPAGAAAALEDVATYLESVFTDSITVSINVYFQNLGGGVLGQTSSTYAGAPSWAATRSGLINGMDTDDYIQNWLPTGSSIPVRYVGTSGTATNESRCFFTLANYNAAIGYMGGTAASMTFNTATTWDYNPSNGVYGMCFKSVAAHEIGHAMGFVSATDFRNYDIEALDLYRFQRTDGAGDYNPDTVNEFQTTARLVDFNTPNDDHNSNLFHAGGTQTEYRMSDGSPSQASHFRQNSVPAVMQPMFSTGQTYYPEFYRDPDKAMFDAIGWDFSLEAGTTTLPFFDDFPTVTPDPELWTGNEGGIANTFGYSEPSQPYSLNLDGAASNGGDRLRSARMNTSTMTDVLVEYYYQRKGGGDSPEPGDDLVVEYFSSGGDWVELARHLGSGPNMTTYEHQSHVILDSNARHSNFRLQFRAISYATGTDDWFVDDVYVWTNQDLDPPQPNPMTWESLPEPISTTAVQMTSTEGIDQTPPVWYFFYFSPAGDPLGGNSSSWVTDRTYVDDGLVANTNYNYYLRARDSANPINYGNFTQLVASAATFIEMPTGIAFGDVTDTSIEVSAEGAFTNLAEGQSGIFFEMTPAAGSGANEWTASQTITITGLSPATAYTFRVKSRNRDAVEDPAPWVGPAQQSTSGGGCPLMGDINGDGVLDSLDVAGFIRAKLGQPAAPGENQACAQYGGTLEEDTAAFVADLLAAP